MKRLFFNIHHWIWHHSKFVRDIYYAIHIFQLKRIAKFLLKHCMWYNADDKERWEQIYEKFTYHL